MIGTVSDPSGTNIAGRGATNRPDYAGTSYGNRDQHTVDSWWDRAAFAVPASNIGRYGNVGPGQLIGPRTSNLSLRLHKVFAIGERISLQLEGSFANVLNHANFGLPARNVTAANFGRVTSTQGAEAGGARTVQLGARFAF